jgi:SAM-dependent methyltransferase
MKDCPANREKIELMDRPLLKHSAVLRENLEFCGSRVLDVGCGDGGLVRFMTRQGASVIGLEAAWTQLGRALAATPAGEERYLQARGEALPLAAGALDIVVFFNSLHHIPIEHQGDALGEAVRVLRPGGRIYVQEPLAEGRYFEMMRPIEDETLVRAKAYEAVKAAAESPLLAEETEFSYRAPYKLESFEAFLSGFVAVDERRAPAVEAHRESLRESFEAEAERRDGAFWFDTPSRLNLLRKE